MTQDEVIVMLSEAIDQNKEYKSWHVSTQHLMTFAKMIEKKEREACAKLCDYVYDNIVTDEHIKDMAFKIRARGQA